MKYFKVTLAPELKQQQQQQQQLCWLVQVDILQKKVGSGVGVG